MRFLFVLLLVIAGLHPASSRAAEAAAALHERGVAHFRAGRFAEALADFEAAEQAGMHSAQLIYNLGSVHYRLGDYARSETYFTWLTDHPRLAGLAWYNLALIAHRLGDDDRARELLRRVAASDADPELRQLAERQLRKLGAPPAAAPSRALNLSGQVDVELGWDSNIELDSAEGGSEQSGDYRQALAYLDAPLGRLANLDWTASASLIAEHYPRDDDFGYRSLALGLLGRRDLDGWQLWPELETERSWLGGDAFLASTTLGLAFTRTLGEGRRLALELDETRHESRASAFDYLVGNQTRFGVAWRLRDGARRHRLRGRIEHNDRRNDADSDSSPRRLMLDWRVEQEIGGDAVLSGQLEWRRSRYDEVAALRRTDDRWRLALGARQRLGDDWRLAQTLQFTANESDLAGEDYRKTLFAVSLRRYF